MQIWDLPGKSSFVALNRMYIRDANVAIIIYDVTDAESLESVDKWIDELKETAPTEIIIALAGNKKDVKGSHTVSLQDGQNLANRHSIALFLETSAKTKENIDRLFTRIA